MGKGFWNSDRMGQLIELAGSRNHSAAEIGAKIGCSRQAVIGKCHRAGIAIRTAEEATTHRYRDYVPAPRIRITPKPRPPAPLPPPGMLTIEELSDRVCRWPEGSQPPYAFCGEAVDNGVYCSGHAALAYSKPTHPLRAPRG